MVISVIYTVDGAFITFYFHHTAIKGHKELLISKKVARTLYYKEK